MSYLRHAEHVQDNKKSQTRTVPLNSAAKDRTVPVMFDLIADCSGAANLTAAANTTPPTSIVTTFAAGVATAAPALAPPAEVPLTAGASTDAAAPQLAAAMDAPAEGLVADVAAPEPAPAPQAPAEAPPAEGGSVDMATPQLAAAMGLAVHLAAPEAAPAELAPCQGTAAHMAALGQAINVSSPATALELAVAKEPPADGAAASLAAHELVPVGTEETTGSCSADLTLAGPAPVEDMTAFEADCGQALRESAKTPEGGVTDYLAPTEGATTCDSDLADQSQAEEAPAIDESGYDADTDQAPRVKTYRKAPEGVVPMSGVFDAIEKVQFTVKPVHSICMSDLPLKPMLFDSIIMIAWSLQKALLKYRYVRLLLVQPAWPRFGVNILKGRIPTCIMYLSMRRGCQRCMATACLLPAKASP